MTKSPFHKFITRHPLYLMLFGHIEALRLNNLQISVDQAIRNFQKIHNLTEDDFNLDTAKTMYYRMAADYRNAQKSDNGNA